MARLVAALILLLLLPPVVASTPGAGSSAFAVDLRALCKPARDVPLPPCDMHLSGLLKPLACEPDRGGAA